MKALLGEKGYGAVLVSELGGRKRDRKKAIVEELENGLRERMMSHQEEDEYQEGSVPGSLYQAYTDLRQGKLFDMLTGASPQEISQRVSEGESPYQGPRQDLQTHALASRLMADRLGAPAARAIGFANEVGGGLVGMARGEGFFGELGFDPQDLNANEIGIESLKQPSLGRSLKYLLTNR